MIAASPKKKHIMPHGIVEPTFGHTLLAWYSIQNLDLKHGIDQHGHIDQSVAQDLGQN